MIAEKIGKNETVNNSESSDKKMFRKLVQGLHPDHDGDHETTIEIYEAYEKAKRGDNKALKELYNEWTSDTSKDKKNKDSANPLEEELKEFSESLFQKWKSTRKTNVPLEFRQISYKYLKLCAKETIRPDFEYITSFLENEGWLPDNFNKEHFITELSRNFKAVDTYA